MEKVDGLANLQLLAGVPNTEKQAKLPAEWLAGPHFPSDELRQTYIAENDLQGLPDGLDGFLEFYEARRERIQTRLRSLLA